MAEHVKKKVQNLLKNDPFSRRMGIKILDANEGFCKCSLRITEDMLNGFEVAHGGIIFSLADTALAFAAATYGSASYTVEHSASFIKKSLSGDHLTAEAACLHMGSKTGVVKVDIFNQNHELIAATKGLVFKTDRNL